MMKHGMPEANDNGFIVVETNYRIYAYTSMCLMLARVNCMRDHSGCLVVV